MNLLSPGVVSFSIVFSFDLDMMQNRFTFGKNLCQFIGKNIFEQKFWKCSNLTIFSSIWVKSGTIRKRIARRLKKWYWILFSVNIRARYWGLKSTGNLISALLYKAIVVPGDTALPYIHDTRGEDSTQVQPFNTSRADLIQIYYRPCKKFF